MPDAAFWSALAPIYAAAALSGYILGSIPFGLILTNLAGVGDIRQIGSGNVGATNVLRTGRKDLAALTLLLDAGKGTVAVLLGAQFNPEIMVIAAAGAFLGHLFPVWLSFNGGKGVATYIGILFGLNWMFGAAACAIWLIVAGLWRYSSLAAMGMSLVMPFLVPVFVERHEMGLVLALSIAVFIRHRGNLLRLFRGEEPKIGRR
jgi:glycerol-3-phosphate acyltransferase PlsY